MPTDYRNTVIYNTEASRRQTIKNIAKAVELSRNRTLSSQNNNNTL